MSERRNQSNAVVVLLPPEVRDPVGSVSLALEKASVKTSRVTDLRFYAQFQCIWCGDARGHRPTQECGG